MGGAHGAGLEGGNGAQGKDRVRRGEGSLNMSGAQEGRLGGKLNVKVIELAKIAPRKSQVEFVRHEVPDDTKR